MKDKRGKSGFTLVEVLIALMIFAFGAMAIFAMQIKAIQTSARARRLTMANELAQFPVESFKSGNFRAFTDIKKDYGGLSTESCSSLDSTFPEKNIAPIPFESNCTAHYLEFEAEATPSFNSPERLEKVCSEWVELFGGNDFEAAKGTMLILIYEDTSDNQVKLADVFTEVQWCDNRGDVAGCGDDHLHSVKAGQRFTNTL